MYDVDCGNFEAESKKRKTMRGKEEEKIKKVMLSHTFKEYEHYRAIENLVIHGIVPEIQLLVLSNLDKLCSVIVGDNSCKKAEGVYVEDCPRLTTLTFGRNCCTNVAGSTVLENADKQFKDISKRVCITNCSSLTTLVMGDGSFVDYAGGLFLKSSKWYLILNEICLF